MIILEHEIKQKIIRRELRNENFKRIMPMRSEKKNRKGGFRGGNKRE